ncbi:MAG: hypothetical protein LC111_14790 [Bacteroidia bacterium]|nr:hypothetical protein [Bacteroidia bacterium]
MSAYFTVPVNAQVGRKGQRIKAAGNIGDGSRADVSISPACGDFDNVPAECKRMNVGQDEPVVHWSIGPNPYRCVLERGSSYYINIRTNGYTTGACRIRIDN